MFIWPLDDHIVTRDFYYRAATYVGGQHAAIDLIRRTGSTRASPIRAVADGVVAGVGWDMYSGFFVAVDHAGGFRSFYRHMYGQTPVIVGQRVVQGQVVGNVGNTGWSQGDHLHFDLWSRNKIRNDDAIFYKNGWYAVDPALYLGKEDDMGMTPDQEIELRLLREQVNVMIGQIGQLGNEATFVRGVLEYLGVSEKEFRVVQGQVNQLVGQHQAIETTPGEHGAVSPQGDYTDQRAVKAVKDALPG